MCSVCKILAIMVPMRIEKKKKVLSQKREDLVCDTVELKYPQWDAKKQEFLDETTSSQPCAGKPNSNTQ